MNRLSCNRFRLQKSLWAAALMSLGVVGWLSVQPAAIAQEEAFPPNPLELTEPDPLLPELIVDRPLSPQERSVLNTALDELQRQGQEQLQQGNLVGAFDLWNRELRLRRYISVDSEIESLSRVGDVAWRENQVTEVRVITERLQEIEQEVKAQTPVNYQQLFAIAQAYQKLRAIDPAVALYQDILLKAQQEGDRDTQIAALTALGDMQVAWFNYAQAADAYLQLLTLTREVGNVEQEIKALDQLAYVYEQSSQPEQAIAMQQQLVSLYERQQELVKIPPIKLAIGDNYMKINRADLAAPSYQEAFAVSRTTQQYGFASDALRRLGGLYQALNRPEDALTVYQLLVDVDQQSYNVVGMMETYDQIGRIYRTLGNEGRAIVAFQRGLQLAQQLNYKVSYFTDLIQNNPPTSPSPTAPAAPQPQSAPPASPTTAP